MQPSSKLSKRERRILRQQLKEATELSKRAKTSLVEGVARSQKIDDEGDRHFTIGHKFYRDDLCKIKNMKHSPLRKIFEGYKNMSRCTTEHDIYDLPMDIKRITVNNHYSKYISGLTPDIELNEFDAGSYRGFFFVDRGQKIIQMVAVDIHPESDKQT